MRRILLAIAAVGCIGAAQAQIRLGDGQLSGSLETNTTYYVNDKDLGFTSPEDHFGSNSYLKVDYNYGRFSAGIQADIYAPALLGYDIGVYGDKHFYLSSKYIQWQDKNFAVLVGDIFDQYGNGLIYRSYEDRQLGFNNSIEGVRGEYSFGRYVSLKGMYGRPRLYTDYADSWVRGADLNVALNEIAGSQAFMLNLEGSYVNRYEKNTFMTPNLNMYSGRVNFGIGGLSLRGEYVHKSDDLSPGLSIDNGLFDGSAYYGELNYHLKGLSVAATFRQLDHMGTAVSLYGQGAGNSLNYLPALTRQYTYMLANLNPYQVHAEGELGGQVDLNYSLRNKKDRYRYWNFHANFSTFYTLDAAQSTNGERRLLWRDLNFDVERQWNKSWKTTLLYSMQEWNPNHGAMNINGQTYISHVFVGDATYKFNRKKSIRFELQYLYSADYEKDWVAALVEFNLAPRWSFYLSDMYNNGTTEKHYYTGGFSYTHNRTRVQLSYGRNREGYVCSGGVCRYTPAYTGVNLVLTTSF